MAEKQTLTDADYKATLDGNTPVLLLVSNGDGLRSEFSVAFKKAIAEQNGIIFAQIDPTKNPDAKAHFNVGEKPVLVAWFDGEEVVRRSRPWGTDVPLAIEMLKNAQKDKEPVLTSDENETPSDEEVLTPEGETPVTPVDTKPVNVTDATFQQEAIDYHLPVVVDFWAEWCGPCRMVAPVLDKLAEEYAGKIRIVKVNVDENPGLSGSFSIQSIPTIMMLKERNIVFSQPGALPEPALRDLFDQLIALEIPPQDEEETEESGEAEPQ